MNESECRIFLINHFIKVHVLKNLAQELAVRNNVKPFQENSFSETFILLVGKLSYRRRSRLKLRS